MALDIEVFNKNIEIMRVNKNNIEDELSTVRQKYQVMMLSI